MKHKHKRMASQAIFMIKIVFNNIKLPSGIFFIFLMIWFFKPGLPNFLGIQNTSTAITLLAVIVGALASILGIIIAVILVAFEILRKTYTTYAFKSFFHNERLRELFYLYISTIIFSTLTIASVSEPLDFHKIGLVYFSLFFFIVSVAILFPYSKRIIASAQSKEGIQELVNQIDHSAISSFSYFRVGVPPSAYISVIEDNPIFILSEVAIRTLKDDDRLTPKLVLVESTNRLLKMLDTPTDRRMTINAYLVIFRNTARQAIQSRQEGTLRTILDCVETIHSCCAEKQIPWHEVIELDETLNSILEESIKTGLDETGRAGLYTIERILEEHLDKNVPKESEIWTLHIGSSKKIPVDHDKSNQWRHVSTGYIEMISSLVEKSIALKRGHVVGGGLTSLMSITSAVIDSKLGDLQKALIIWWSCYYAKTLILKCVDEGIYKEVTVLSPFNSSTINHALGKKVEYSRKLLLQFSELLFQLAQRNSLDPFILNELGTVGRGAVRKLGEDKIYKETLIFVSDVFSKLREIIEAAGLSEENKGIYLELHSQTESLRKWMQQHKKKDQEVENTINDVLSKFDELQTFKKERRERLVRWPQIDKKEK